MHKIILLMLFFLIQSMSFGQVYYGYNAKIDDIIKNKVVSRVWEVRNSEKENFRLYIRDTGLYSTNCLNFRYSKFSAERIQFKPSIYEFQETEIDSIVYENEKPKIIFHYRKLTGLFTSRIKITFKTSDNAKIDTAFYQDYRINENNTIILDSCTYRTLLYRNNLGVDSLYTSQYLKNGIWRLGIDLFQYGFELFDYKYDKEGNLIQTKVNTYFGPPTNTSFFYTGNRLTLKVDTIDMYYKNIIQIKKTAYTYNTLGQQTIQIDSLWESASKFNQFIPVSRIRNVYFNPKNLPTQTFEEQWINDGWVDYNLTYRSYVDDSLEISRLEYYKNGTNWSLRDKLTIQYCGIKAKTKDSQPLNVIIFPNPAQNNITINAEGFNQLKNQLIIFDNLGHLILQKKDIDFPFTLDLSNFANGFYFVKIIDEMGHTLTQKIAVLK
jgi:Secretion system C-terminal sorting domain